MDKSFEDSYETVFKTFNELMGDVIEKHIDQLTALDKLIPLSATFSCITNTTKKSFEYVSKNFKYATGLERDKITEQGMTFWWIRYHPEEAAIWLQVLGEFMEFTLKEIPFNDRKRVSYIWNCSIRNNKEKYLNVT